MRNSPEAPLFSPDYHQNMIRAVRKVVVPVEDEIRAKEFWTAQIGFDLTLDEANGDNGRWIEVHPPNRSVALVLNRRPPGEHRKEVAEDLPHSPVFFNCDDIHRTYRELTQRGVKFPVPPVKMPWGWWALFEDHEGTRYALGQW